MIVWITGFVYLESITEVYGIKMEEKEFEKWWNNYIQNYFKQNGHMNMPLKEAARLGFIQGMEYAKEQKEYRWNGVIE